MVNRTRTQVHLSNRAREIVFTGDIAGKGFSVLDDRGRGVSAFRVLLEDRNPGYY